jgi:hypothetical protein
VPTRHKKKSRRGWPAGLVAVLAVLVITVLAWPRGDGRGEAPGSQEPSVGHHAATGSANPHPSTRSTQEITLNVSTTVNRLATVPVTGSYHAAEPGTSLHVQLREEDGSWLSFPLPIAVDESGRYETYVELGRPGTNRLRVVDPASGTTSNVVTVDVR